MNKALPIVVAIVLATILFFWHSKKNGPIKKDLENVLVVGTNAEYPPFTFIKDNKKVGFDIDLATEVVKHLKKNMTIMDMPFDSLIPQAQLGKIHFIAAGMSPSPERAKRLFFTKPYLSGDPLVIITLAQTEPLQTIEDIKGKPIVVNQGFTADFYLSKIDGMDLMRLNTIAEAFIALNSGRAKAFVTAEKAADPFLKQYGKDKFAINPIEGTTDDYAFAISKKYPDLHKKIDAILQELEQDGTIAKLLEKWKLK